MKIRNLEVELSHATKLHNFLYISGWVESLSGSLFDVNLLGANVNSNSTKRLVIPSEATGLNKVKYRFEIQSLLDSPYALEEDLALSFIFGDSEPITISVTALLESRSKQFPTNLAYKEFSDLIRGHSGAKVLDLGGRDRSRLDRTKQFPGVDFTVLDIVASANVDVVADAHEMSRFLPKDTFDYVISLSVFEHLAMPWKVAIEMNKIMKVGGHALIQAPQSIGMHDLPWDFWRFSDSAWKTLFNSQTGFEIISKFRDVPNYVLPFLVREDQLNAEEAAGFEISLVIVRKVSKAKENWHTRLEQVAEGHYPTDV